MHSILGDLSNLCMFLLPIIANKLDFSLKWNQIVIKFGKWVDISIDFDIVLCNYLSQQLLKILNSRMYVLLSKLFSLCCRWCELGILLDLYRFGFSKRSNNLDGSFTFFSHSNNNHILWWWNLIFLLQNYTFNCLLLFRVSTFSL